MLIEFRVNNFKAIYAKDGWIYLTLRADKDITKFSFNVSKKNGADVLKSAVIYGADNAGKSCLIQAIGEYKNALLTGYPEIRTNIFTNDKVCEMGATFAYGDKIYDYAFKYDTSTTDPESRFVRGFIYECFREMTLNGNGEIVEKEVLFLRDQGEGKYFFNHDEELSKTLNIFATNTTIFHVVNCSIHPLVGEYKTLIEGFANTIEIIDLDYIPLQKTIYVLKREDNESEKVREFIKHSDVGIDDIYMNHHILDTYTNSTEQKAYIANPALEKISLLDRINLTTERNGKKMIATEFESIGTLKLIALASYIVEAMDGNKTLIIDHLDGMHQREIRAINMFFTDNNPCDSQLITATQNIELMDDYRLLRRDQIYYMSQEDGESYLYTAQDVYEGDDSREHEDEPIQENYHYGYFGAVPEPDALDILRPINNTENKN